MQSIETIVTAEQRMDEIASRDAFKQERVEAELALSNKLRMDMTVAERLMRRVKITRFKTIFSDDLGDVAVETRQMTSTERSRAVELNDLLAQSEKDPDKYADAVKKYKEFAKEITLTPGMDVYYDSDQVSDDVLIAIVTRTFQGTMKLVGESITSFRAE